MQDQATKQTTGKFLPKRKPFRKRPLIIGAAVVIAAGVLLLPKVFSSKQDVPQLDLIFKLADSMDISITQILPKRYVQRDTTSELKVSPNYSHLSEVNKRIVTDTLNRLIDNLLAAQ